MAYMKTVKMTIEEAILSEFNQGFESSDEYFEVIRDIAREYNVTTGDVFNLIFVGLVGVS